MSGDALRGGCRGVSPLPARLEEWQRAIAADPARLDAWLDRHGSPVNLIHPASMRANADELAAAATRAGVAMRVFFARKANKALCLVDEAARLGLGVDVASERELSQTLTRGVPASRVIVTAAVKPLALLSRSVGAGVAVAIDNHDEHQQMRRAARDAPEPAPIALRLAPATTPGRPPTRFGVPLAEAIAIGDQAAADSDLAIAGVHFHLDGYDARERVAAIGESVALVDALRRSGHSPTFIDIGGGIPMSYLDDEAPWEDFWRRHRAALAGDGDPLTFDGHGLGLRVEGGQVVGHANVYPAYQRPVRGAWLDGILGARLGTGSVADAFRDRGLELRCEPGRSLLDGCGMTAARVEFRKRRADGTWLIGLAMNRTQLRSAADDFLVDPLLVSAPVDPAADAETGPIEGHLVGAYCIERELITWRRLAFPRGVSVGDIVLFPNTAGYMMHILESASHQIPLARNLAIDADLAAVPDPIDDAPDARVAARPVPD